MKGLITFWSVLMLCFFTSHFTQSQNIFPSNGAVGIGTDAPDSSSLIDVNSTTKGILAPRMTKKQRDLIVSPALGLLIYQTNSTPGFYYYSGTEWTAVSGKGANKQLNNLTAPTGVNVVLQPNANNTIDLGSSAFSWKDVYVDGVGYLGSDLLVDGLCSFGSDLSVDGIGSIGSDLHVGGVSYISNCIKIGNYTGASQAGMIRWTGSDYEGFNGTIWVSLTATGGGPNKQLSNLTAPTGVNVVLQPNTDNTRNLGSSAFSWKDLYVDGVSYLGSSVKIGNYTGTAQAGMIRWTGIDYEGYNGTSWVSLTSTNGTSQWITTGNNIYYNSGNVGVGVSNPGAKLDVNGKTKTTSLQVTNGATAGSVMKSDASGNATWQTLDLTDLLGGFTNSDFSCLSVIGTVDIFGTSIAVTGNYAFVVGGDMKVINVSNPSAPFIAGAIGVSGSAVDISGNYAYVVGSGMQIIDISNPSIPFVVSNIGVDGSSIAVLGNYAYVVGNGMLQVIDVSNPSAPFEAGNISIGGSSVAVSNNYAYVVGSGMHIIDVSNPSAPFEASYIGVSGSSVAVSNNYAYVVGSSMHIIDVSNPSAPFEASYIGVSGSSVAVSNNYAYVVGSGMHIIDVSIPSAPFEVGSISVAGNSVAASGYVYVLSDMMKVIQPTCSSSMGIVSGTIVSQPNTWHQSGTAIYNANNGNVGIGISSPTHRLQLSNDDAAKTSTSTWVVTSDERLKDIRGDYHKGLKEIVELHPINYFYKNVDGRTFTSEVLAKENQGFSAQAVQKIFPEAIVTDSDGYLNLNIHPIIVAQVNAIKELNTELEDLKIKAQNSAAVDPAVVSTLQNKLNQKDQMIADQQEQINGLNNKLDQVLNKMSSFETSLAQCCSADQSGIGSKLNDPPKLEQNIPNPFLQTSYIKFYIPSSTNSAMLIITDVSGSVVKEFTNLQIGYGTVEIDYSNLGSGTYQYTLVIDGNKVDTKQMILTK